jgi:hypothetical protein
VQEPSDQPITAAPKKGRFWLLHYIVPVIVAVPMIGVAVVGISIYLQFHQTDLRIRCASHMKAIGQAILLYSNDNEGHYPPDLGTLVKSQNISLDNFLAPSMPGGDSLPSNLDQMTRNEQADWANHHGDFIYVGAGLEQGGDPSTPVLYEKRVEDNSAPDLDIGPKDVQVLFRDGHVEQVPPSKAPH